jgi:hypothetical protein
MQRPDISLLLKEAHLRRAVHELSYLIWRRVADEEADEYADTQLASATPSDRFLPPVEFSAGR